MARHMMNKGAGSLMWKAMAILIFLLVSFMLITSVVNIVGQGTRESVRNSAKINSEEIAGIINSLKASPAIMQVFYKLPAKDCTVTITENDVKFELSSKTTTGGKVSDFNRASFFGGGIPVSPATSECNSFKEKSILIERSEAGIKFSEATGETE